MAQDINPLSSPEAIESLVRGYIVTAPDGSQRLNDAELATKLSEQFGYLNGPGSFATPASKDAEAYTIAQRLRDTVNRENWNGNPAYPNPGNNESDAVRARLIELRNLMSIEAAALEAPYREFDAGLPLRAKNLFAAIVAPSFPAGIELIETTRAYVETLVTDWGEESRPSEVSALLTLDQNDYATVTCSAAPAGRHITKRRLYRSATGTTLSAYKLQGEYPVAQTVIVDQTLDAQLNDVCATFGWLEPPTAMKGLTALPNGIMLGYVGRTLHACEPYHPYAWPAKYDKPLGHDITGIVAVGQSAFVGTTGRPYLVSGSDSASLSEELISSKVPCLAARSMVAIGNSAFYASPDGLALYEAGKVTIVTKGAVDRDKWRSYQPASMRAAEFNGMYLAFFTRTDNSRGCLVFDYETRAISELDQAADAVFGDEDGIYLLNGSVVLDCMPAAGANRAARWDSKQFLLARPQAFGWIHVDSRFRNGVAAAPVTLRIYADDVLHHTVTVTNRAPVRNKPGRAINWRVEIESAAIVSGVVLATTTEELKAVLS